MSPQSGVSSANNDNSDVSTTTGYETPTYTGRINCGTTILITGSVDDWDVISTITAQLPTSLTLIQWSVASCDCSDSLISGARVTQVRTDQKSSMLIKTGFEKLAAASTSMAATAEATTSSMSILDTMPFSTNIGSSMDTTRASVDADPSKSAVTGMLVGIVLGSLAPLAVSLLAVQWMKMRDKRKGAITGDPSLQKIKIWCGALTWFSVFSSKVCRRQTEPEAGQEQGFSDKTVTVREGGDSGELERAELSTNANRRELSARQSVNGDISGWQYG